LALVFGGELLNIMPKPEQKHDKSKTELSDGDGALLMITPKQPPESFNS
jgi:hypothetical protein